MNIKNKILALSFTFILVFTLLFIAIKMDFQGTYDVTKKELDGIETLSDIYSLNFNLKIVRGLSQIADDDADYIKNLLLISDDDILSMIKKIEDKKIEEIYKNIKSSDKMKAEYFKLYTELLNILDDKRFSVADTSQLLFEHDREIYFLITVGIFNIPDIIENIGKIRAIGSLHLSSGEQLSSENLFILNNNEHMFLKGINKIKLILSKISDNDSRKLHSLLDEVLTKFHNTKKHIEDIKTSSSELTSKEYFIEVTELINTINKLHIFTKYKEISLLQKRKDNFYNKIILSIIVFSLIISVIIITTYLAYKKNRIDEELYNKKNINQAIKNKLISKFEQDISLTNICNSSLNLIIDSFKALNGSLYLYNEDNNKLYLASYYGQKSTTLVNTIDLHENTISENILEKKIKIIEIEQDVNLGNISVKATKLVNTPIMEFDNSIGIVQLIFENKHKDVDLDFLQELASLVASYIFKAQKDEETARYLKLIDKNVLISKTDLSGKIIEVSEQLCQLSQYTKDELIGQNHRILRHPDMKEDTFIDIWETISSGETWYGEIKNRKKDGSYYWVDSIIAPDFDMTGNQIGYTALRVDITDKKKIELLSITDSLTSLYNRRHFDNIFVQQTEINAREKDIFLVFVLIDIDHFKQYNDIYGHQDGDTTLKLVANALKKTIQRPDDYTFRLGGEEFGLLYHVNKKDDAIVIANEARKNVENLKIQHSGNSASQYVTISSGLYIIEPDDKTTCGEIYKKADQALYVAKESGRNQVRIAT